MQAVYAAKQCNLHRLSALDTAFFVFHRFHNFLSISEVPLFTTLERSHCVHSVFRGLVAVIVATYALSWQPDLRFTSILSHVLPMFQSHSHFRRNNHYF